MFKIHLKYFCHHLLCLTFVGVGCGFPAGAVWRVIASQLFAMSAWYGRGVDEDGFLLVAAAVGWTAGQELWGA